ncbi:expressed unknown protein [Ectocarpus siliculosus]|uniref:Uncharacterized protein n=1 Tax=Ectocarpus siliculosus TaxID=2880 RepID=D8LDA8_ECTSI|nr:expressed unknown protein [Ectocarpus siliculosus]|eukprot:CBN80166.1 expressed unknown protein [Ectocarpus siliculosus]
MPESKVEMKKEGGGSARLGIGIFSRGPPSRHMAIEEYAVDWNGPSTAPPPRLRLLLLADVDLASAGRIVEWAIQGGKAFDLCAVCGDFVPRPEGWSPNGETEEQLSAEEGEMSSTLGKLQATQLENTVCRVIYVPGPLDPVIPSIRLPRTRNTAAVPTTASRPPPVAAATPGADAGRGAEGRGGQRDGGKERVLQLTPTSKNVLRRNLRLAPGLSAAGFSEDPNQCPGNTVGAGEGGGGAGDDTPEDQTFAALKSLSRSGGKKGAGKAAPVPPESVILLTRLGGPRRPGGGAGGAGATVSSADTPPTSNSNSNQDTLNVAKRAAGPTEVEDQEAATAARLRLLWTEPAMAVGPESGPRGLEDGGGGGLLLHACAGPGTLLAVREALEEGGAEPVGGGGAGGDGDCARGVGCRVGGGTTVAALGSLRQHGAYCVVELDMPATVPPGPRSGNGSGGVGAKEGWSVASVAFGRVEAADGDPEAEREKLAHRATGSFVLNFE